MWRLRPFAGTVRDQNISERKARVQSESVIGKKTQSKTRIYLFGMGVSYEAFACPFFSPVTGRSRKDVTL